MTSRRFTASIVVAAAIALAAEPGMVFIPGGDFQRGRTHKLPDDGLKWWPELLTDDRPVRKVTLEPFYMDTHEVAIGDYAKFVKAKRHRPPYNWPKSGPPAGKDKFPVSAVSWDDASAYCAWAGKRLPTEAEWERAARGLAEGAKYPWGDGDVKKTDARYGTVEGPVAVGQYPPNYFGLYDVAGNVWEWTADWYEKDYYATAPEKDPRGPEKGMYKVLRGGSWADLPKYLTTAHRSWARPAERSPNIGFRCVKGFGKR
jgi:formylglycine-generating enzyme required for sulfatase activity